MVKEMNLLVVEKKLRYKFKLVSVHLMLLRTYINSSPNSRFLTYYYFAKNLYLPRSISNYIVKPRLCKDYMYSFASFRFNYSNYSIYRSFIYYVHTVLIYFLIVNYVQSVELWLLFTCIAGIIHTNNAHKGWWWKAAYVHYLRLQHWIHGGCW